MTSSSFSSSRVHRKRRTMTPIASKTWKERLRQACLYRAREQRRQEEPSPNSIAGVIDIEEDRVIRHSARHVIEQEMRELGVSVVCPCATEAAAEGEENIIRRRLDDHCKAQQEEEDAPMLTSSEGEHDRRIPQPLHRISEEELFELLQEVEEEMQRMEALRLEEELQMVRNEQLYLEDQIAEFDSLVAQPDEDDDQAVLCPLCQESNLTESVTGGEIMCPNHMDGSCPMRLTTSNRSRHPILSLKTLRESLRCAYEDHSKHCEGVLFFEVCTTTTTPEVQDCAEEAETRLLAMCNTCQTSFPLA